MTAIARVVAIITAVCFGAAGCSKSNSKPGSESSGLTPAVSEQKKITSAGVVKATVQPVDIDAGSTGETTVRISIDSGYHVNANPPTYPYLKATELVIAPASGFTAGEVRYPPALTKEFSFAEQPLAIYEGQTDLRATIKVAPSANKGQQTLSATLRIQACDDQVCYPPGTIDLKIPVTVK